MLSLVISKISRLFVNTLAADEMKYSLRNCENLRQPIQMQLSKKNQLILTFLHHFSNLHQISNILKKKMTLIAYVFSKLRTAKYVVR